MSSVNLGIKDFITMTDEFNPQWSLFAIESAIEEVLNFLTSCHKPFHLENSVPIRSQTIKGTLQEKLEGKGFASVIPVVKACGSSWTLVYSAVFYGNISAPNDADVFAKNLNTRTVAFVREDTSESLGYELFDKGEQSQLPLLTAKAVQEGLGTARF